MRRAYHTVGCIFEENKTIAVVSLSRPEQLNAMNVEMGHEFKQMLNELPHTVRCVVLTGKGKAFSAGGDIQFLEDRARDTPHHNTQEMLRFYDRFLSMRRLKVPIISAINGPAVGAGLCLAMATDIRVTYSECMLQLPFSTFGLHPGMAATFFLPQVAGYETALRLLLTGDKINGKQAKEMGLVSECLNEPEDVLTKSLEIASSIASCPPVGIETTLMTLRRQQELYSGGLASALAREADAQAACYATPEFLEQVLATKERISSKKKQR